VLALTRPARLAEPPGPDGCGPGSACARSVELGSDTLRVGKTFMSASLLLLCRPAVWKGLIVPSQPFRIVAVRWLLGRRLSLTLPAPLLLSAQEFGEVATAAVAHC
jgi:hypothetical protein